MKKLLEPATMRQSAFAAPAPVTDQLALVCNS
jgi:hypothetical protein